MGAAVNAESEGLVYVLRRALDQHVKIGRCLQRTLTPRLADLRRTYGELTLIHTELAPEFKEVERTAHRMLKRHRRYGEFFEITPEVGIATVREAVAKVEATPVMFIYRIIEGSTERYEKRPMSRPDYRLWKESQGASR